MKDLHIPFRFRRITRHASQPFGEGGFISTFNQCGLFFCKQGEVEVSSEGHAYLIKQNDLYLYMPSTLVRIMRRSPEAEGIMLEADMDYALSIVNKVTNTESLLHIRNHPCISLPEAQAIHLERLLEQLWERIRMEEKEADNTSCRHLTAALIKSMGETLFYEVLTIYFRNQPLKPLPQDKNDQVFQNFMLSLFRFYRKERDVAFYASLQHITPRYFSTLIKKKSGCHASRWITQMVVVEAKQMLENSDLSIKEITEELNFPTQSFFGKYFKQYTGLSPKEYRKSRFTPDAE